MTSNSNSFDFVIIGGGAVGLWTAHQLSIYFKDAKIIVLEKEENIGLHSSGRNSGVLHAGIYYEPGSTKARVCVEGRKRLVDWIEERKLPLNRCGKVITCQKKELDSQLDVLINRAHANGANAKIVNANDLQNLLPGAFSASGRAIYSPETAVTKPIAVIKRLEQELTEKGIHIKKGITINEVNATGRRLVLSDNEWIEYGHLFNCAGLYSNEIAKKFGIARNYKIMPFKGLYWKIKDNSDIKITRNLYPVPDLNMPFLGVHFTPSADAGHTVSIGPTAVLATGRENYFGFENSEPLKFISNIGTVASEYIANRNGFRGYVHEQALLSIKALVVKEACKIYPELKFKDLEISQKVGIRAQLFDNNENKLENEFLCLEAESSTHVLNAISPAFTASSALADLIIEKANL